MSRYSESERKQRIRKILQEVYENDWDDDDGNLCEVCLDNFIIDILALLQDGGSELMGGSDIYPKGTTGDYTDRMGNTYKKV